MEYYEEDGGLPIFKCIPLNIKRVFTVEQIVEILLSPSISARLSTTTYCPRCFELSTIHVTSESGGVNGNTRKWFNQRQAGQREDGKKEGCER